MNEINKINKLSILESQSLHLTRKLVNLVNIRRLFKTKERWDDARKLDVDLFVRNYGDDFVEYISMDLNAINEDISLTYERIRAIHSEEDLNLLSLHLS